MPTSRITAALYLLISCLIPIQTFTQSQGSDAIDSLEQLLEKQPPDTGRVNLLNRIGDQLQYNAVNDQAIRYELEALSLGKELGFIKGVAQAYNNLGYIYRNRRDLTLAMANFDSLKIFSGDHGYPKGMALAHMGTGLVLTDMGRSAEGIIQYTLAIKLFRETGSDRGVEGAYIWMGNNYYVTGMYPEALESYLACLRSAEMRGDTNNMGDAYFGLGLVYTAQKNFSEALASFRKALEFEGEETLNTGYLYHNMGEVYNLMGNLPDAMIFIEKAKRIKEKHGDIEGLMNSLTATGDIFLKQGQYSRAREQINKAIELCGDNKTYYVLALAHILLGESYLLETISVNRGRNEKGYIQARQYLEQGLETARAFGDKESVMRAFLDLAKTDSATGNFRSAFLYLQQYTSFKDSLLNAQDRNRMSQILLGYQTEKLDREIALLEGEKKLKEEQLDLLRTRNRLNTVIMIAAIAGVILLLAVVFFVFSSRRKLKKAYDLVNQQKEEIECQKEEVETQKEALVDTLDKLKKTQAQLIQSEKMASLGMLTAGIAHEINNPVNFINSGAISLQKDYEDLQRIIHSIEKLPPEAQKIADETGMEELLKNIPQTIEDIKTGVQRTSEIVHGLRNFSRLDAAELKESDLYEGIDSTLLLLSHKLKDRIRIAKEYDPKIRFIKCHPGPLNQVFMNLLNNAIDAIDQKLRMDTTESVQAENISSMDRYQIGITTKLTGEGMNKQVKIVISDNGVGIRDEIRDKLFDPFFTTKEVGKGTGLGLSICHGIIEKHGGSITFESKVSEGSTFTITLPLE